MVVGLVGGGERNTFQFLLALTVNSGAIVFKLWLHMGSPKEF